MYLFITHYKVKSKYSDYVLFYFCILLPLLLQMLLLLMMMLPLLLHLLLLMLLYNICRVPGFEPEILRPQRLVR